jgi:hypothetical protein
MPVRASAKVTLSMLGACVVCGCAMVEKIGTDGAVERSVALLSPVSIVGGSPDSARAIRVAGFGLGLGQDSAVLGAYEISAVHLDRECRVVVMPQRNVELENLRRFLEQTPNVCADKK